MILFALVLLRMTGLVRRNEEAVRSEAALRIGGEALVTAISREEIYSAALQAARSLVDEDVVARLYLIDGREDQLTAVAAAIGITRASRRVPCRAPRDRARGPRERRVVTVERAGRRGPSRRCSSARSSRVSCPSYRRLG